MPKILVLAATLGVALALVPTALAGYGYVWPARAWSNGQDGSSTYSSAWKRNWFQKSGQGYDTTATFIDNVSYSWHNTVRNTWAVTATQWTSSVVKKAYARSYSSGFTGSCIVFEY